MRNLGAALAGGLGNRRNNDFYPTPWEATVALMKRVPLPPQIWEPACGDGAISKILETAGHQVFSSDLVDHGYGEVCDFLADDTAAPISLCAVVTNPPFALAEQFIRKSVASAKMTALLLKAQFWHAARRQTLFQAFKPSLILPLTWRLDFTNGGAPTMDCMWCVWGSDESGYDLLPKPAPSEHPALA